MEHSPAHREPLHHPAREQPHRLVGPLAHAHRLEHLVDPAATKLVAPLIGRGSGATRVLTSHDPQAALAEADLVLGLDGGRAAFVAEPSRIDPEAVARLYA